MHIDTRQLREMCESLLIESNRNHIWLAGYSEIVRQAEYCEITESLAEYAISADSKPIGFWVRGSKIRPEKQEFERICRLIKLLPEDERPSIERCKTRKNQIGSFWSFAPANRQPIGIFAEQSKKSHRLPNLPINAPGIRKSRSGGPKSGPVVVTRLVPESASPARVAACMKAYDAARERAKARAQWVAWRAAIVRNGGIFGRENHVLQDYGSINAGKPQFESED